MIHIFMNYTPHLHASILDFFRILRKRLRCYIVLFFRSFDPSSLVCAALLLYIHVWTFCRIFPSNYVFNKPLYIALYTLYIIHTHTSKCGINAIPILELNHEWDLQTTVYCTGILFWRKETQGKIYTYKTTGNISKVQLSSFSSITVLKFEVPKWKWKAAAIKHASLAAGLKSLAPILKKIG